MIKTIELKMRFVATFTLRHYLSDLNIDFEFIQTHNPERFIWITHDCGTHFIRFWKTEELPSSVNVYLICSGLPIANTLSTMNWRHFVTAPVKKSTTSI